MQPLPSGDKKAMHDSSTGQETNKIVSQVLELRRILVPIDFSPHSEKALTLAVPIAKQFNAKITLLYVCDGQLYANEFAYVPTEESTPTLRSFATSRIAPELLGETWERNGAASDEIVKAARELNADLIVITTHGRTGLKHVMLGSTAERIIRYAPCPVLVVRVPESLLSPKNS